MGECKGRMIKMNKKRWIALGIAFAFLLLYGYMQFKAAILPDQTDGKFKEKVIEQGTGDKIAIMEVEGVIVDQGGTSPFIGGGYNHQLFLDQLEHAFEDSQVDGIILKVNSPGGGVVESAEIFHRIGTLKEKYPNKPIVTYMSTVAASGGYYISAATDKIYANRATITGSIGVILSTYNVSELADEWGVKQVTFKSGPHKDILSPMREVTEEERKIIQSIVDESYNQFIDAIVEGRGMSKEEVKKLATGRIFTGTQAKEAGLIDETGYLTDAIDEVAQLAEIENPTIVEYQTNRSLFQQYLSMMASKLPGFNIKFDSSIQKIIPHSQLPKLMYLWEW